MPDWLKAAPVGRVEGALTARRRSILDVLVLGCRTPCVGVSTDRATSRDDQR